MILRIAHTGKGDLIVQSTARGFFRLRPLSPLQRFFRVCHEMPIGDQEIVVIRTENTKEPGTGMPLRTPV